LVVENPTSGAGMSDKFREIYGNELADQVEQLKKKRTGVEVLKPKTKPVEPKQQPNEDERWWDR
jgi:hypothetical protein